MSTACIQLGGSRVEFGENAIAAPHFLKHPLGLKDKGPQTSN